MHGLNSVALSRLRDAGLTPGEWTVLRFGGGPWRGAACGCDHPECGNIHHGSDDACWCLPEQIEEWLEDVAAVEVWRLHRQAELSGSASTRDLADRAASEWAKRYHPGALEVALDVEVLSLQGIVLAYPNRGAFPANAVPREEGGYWRLAWIANGDGAFLPEHAET